MEITPRALRDVVFRERLRGYDEDDVDGFLERVATGVEILQERLRHALERAELAERRAAEKTEGDDAMRRTLSLAQRTADLAVEEARQQAARVEEEANEQARQIVLRAQELARRQAAEAQDRLRRDIAELEAGRDQIRADVAAFQRYLEGERSRLRLALGDAIRWIDEAIPSLVPSPVEHHPPLPPPPREPDLSRVLELPEAPAVEPPAVEPPAVEPPAVEGAPVVAEVPDPTQDEAPAHDGAPAYEEGPLGDDVVVAYDDDSLFAQDPVHDEAVAPESATVTRSVGPYDHAADRDAREVDEATEPPESEPWSPRSWWRRWSSSAEQDPASPDQHEDDHDPVAEDARDDARAETVGQDESSADARGQENPPSPWNYDHARSL